MSPKHCWAVKLTQTLKGNKRKRKEIKMFEGDLA